MNTATVGWVPPVFTTEHTMYKLQCQYTVGHSHKWLCTSLKNELAVNTHIYILAQSNKIFHTGRRLRNRKAQKHTMQTNRVAPRASPKRDPSAVTFGPISECVQHVICSTKNSHRL